jgi:hypothetical protein
VFLYLWDDSSTSSVEHISVPRRRLPRVYGPPVADCSFGAFYRPLTQLNLRWFRTSRSGRDSENFTSHTGSTSSVANATSIATLPASLAPAQDAAGRQGHHRQRSARPDVRHLGGTELAMLGAMRQRPRRHHASGHELCDSKLRLDFVGSGLRELCRLPVDKQLHLSKPV